MRISDGMSDVCSSDRDQSWCRIAFRRMRYEGTLTPPGLDRPALIYPGYGGGINWGGVSVDRRRGIMVVNSNRFANSVRLISRDEARRRNIVPLRSEEHTSELQSLMRISYAVFCLKKKTKTKKVTKQIR